MKTPNYQKIYEDLIKFKGLEDYMTVPKLERSIDIIKFNKLISKQTVNEIVTRQGRSYDEDSILELLHYQIKYDMSNTQLALEFKLSRNTVARWKKIYNVK
ncbi:helix-turn-helix domain-containing protein [Chryseobacterium sp. RP-3-3]|uniref:Helix-turn-helix domain-containing protein n=1 Tax=Chryseobacterium antibioticum TaxID=2728847 RepID=A0A7Y0AQR7_9FLAO|nr:helix-turn-helix domain-containing protein [Chryseobacterium antibioticum]NML71784.1 helix-turn-helix domain-containing protein [Chryseobacterium antibioticum]